MRMANFKNIDRKTPYLLPPSLEDWLPENHLGRFVVDVVSQLDLNSFRSAYRSGGGNVAYDPALLLGMLFYGYATGIYSSRKLEKTPDIPVELENRKQRIAKIQEAKRVIEERARKRDEENQAEYDEKLAERNQKREQTGRKPRGKKPAPPEKGPRAKDQYNFTDPESRIMRTSSSGFQQCYNAQAAVDQDSMLIVGYNLTNNTNDKNELIPVLESIPAEIGHVENVAADAGYFSEKNIEQVTRRKTGAFIAPGRQPHSPTLDEILQNKKRPGLSEISCKGLSQKEAMKLRLNTTEGHAIYRLRKCTAEPVFGIIKQILGLRQFLLRGLMNVHGEWCLFCCGYNLKRMHSLKFA